jgi:branched-chain amino acid transport system permease protein
MELFLNQLFNGIENGAIYASIALALVIVFRTTGLFNFAQGEMAMLSTFLTWQLSTFMPIVPAIVVSMALSFLGGALIERTLIRPMEARGNPLGTVIITIALFIGLNALIQLIWPPSRAQTDPFTMPRPFPEGSATIEVFGASLRTFTIWFVALLLVECVVLWLLLQKTKLGLSLRAVASNQESSRLVGIDVGKMLMVGWGLAAAIGALAGSVVASRSGQFDVSMMQFTLAYAFAAAALGGFDSPLGAVVGGFIVGIADAMAVTYIDAVEGIQIVVPLALIFLVLLLRPQGMFGRKVVERV